MATATTGRVLGNTDDGEKGTSVCGRSPPQDQRRAIGVELVA